MNEDTWFKWLIISTVIHVLVISAFSIPLKKSYKRFDALSSYSVTLVGGPGAPQSGDTGKEKAAIVEKKAGPQRRTPPAKVKKPVPAPVPPKAKPVPIRKEKEAVSLSKKKAPPKPVPANESPSREELSRLEDRLREMKKRTDYLDVTQKKAEAGSGKSGGGFGKGVGSGLPMGGGNGPPLDLVTQKYYMEVWEKIKDAWALPGMSAHKKNLETVLTIKIRKDGRIVDINVEKRSGNRVYDESVMRVLRAVDPLPPLPASLNTDSLEVGFRFRPEDMS